MQHLQPYRDEFRYRTGTEGDVISIEVSYDLGGSNMFSGTRSARGIYISVRPVTLKDGMVSFVLGAGIKALVAPLNRANPKKLLAVAEKLDAHVLTIGEQAKADTRAAIQTAAAMFKEVAA